jgi:hypothetical protein
MAKNLGRKYATMSEDELRKFALKEEAGSADHPAELAFEEPRDEDHMGRHYAGAGEEIADPERRDGMSAQLDVEEHQRALRDTDAESESDEEAES